jgi:predicted adenylyl cyclase CyaB
MHGRDAHATKEKVPFEIEIKLKVDHLAPVRDRLKQLGAVRIGEALETNLFFDTPDHVLLAAGSGLRIRRARDPVGGTEKLIVTYKGPRDPGVVKRREEIELTVDDADHAIALLARLGYPHQLSFEKRRESWTLDQARVEMDLLPELGSFVEIECPTEAEVLRARDMLGLADATVVAQTYPELVSRHLSQRRAGEATLKFS